MGAVAFEPGKVKQFFKTLSPYVEAFLDFVYPPFCLICQRRLPSALRLVCGSCWEGLPRLETPKESFECKNADWSIDASLAIWEFSADVRNLVHEFKYAKIKSLAKPLGDAMAELANNAEEYRHATMIVPVPLHRTKQRERGFNQSTMLGERIARSLDTRLEVKILQRVRNTSSQAQLDAAERAENMRGAFALRNGVKLTGAIVMLVDDVFTTGATLNACATCLREAGAEKILTLTAAKTL